MMEELIKKVFQKVTVIDDKKEEVKNLIEHLEKEGIKTIFLEPNEEESNEHFENFNDYPGNLIFMDLHLSSSGANNVTHISKIRNILKKLIDKKNISYGLILWTSYPDEVNGLQEKLIEDKNEYTLPLFVFGMDKKEFNENPEQIFSAVAEKLKENTAASFYIKWSGVIENAKSKVLNDIFSLAGGYEYQNENLEFLLFQMAKNYVGINDEDLGEYEGLQKDAFNAFSELLAEDLKCFLPVDKNCKLFDTVDNIKFLFRKEDSKFCKKNNEFFCNGLQLGKKDSKRDIIENELSKTYAMLNSKLLLDFQDYNLVLPGNIYIIKNEKFFSNKMDTSREDIPIVIELTPPCDFAQKKNALPKFISGFITEFENCEKVKGNAFYKETYPLYMPEIDNDKIFGIILDFRYINNFSEDEVNSNFEFIFRVKDKLFADILQKMSSYTARLGLSIIR
jgi:CheY-like chemotaxis protein